MSTQLFNEIIFGPIKSRRLGLSLGINLLPLNNKLCNFNCIYCECGWTDLRSVSKVQFVDLNTFSQLLKNRLIDLKNSNTIIDSITFAGNGEPTMHPDFLEIIKCTILLRNNYSPKSKISVLTNSLMLNNKKVEEALLLVENRIMKLDAGTEKMYQLINDPLNKKSLSWVVNQLEKFKNNCTIQTMFLKGEINGKYFDNTSKSELEEWIKKIKLIQPKEVMLYSIDRDTPAENIERIPENELKVIAERLSSEKINANVY